GDSSRCDYHRSAPERAALRCPARHHPRARQTARPNPIDRTWGKASGESHNTEAGISAAPQGGSQGRQRGRADSCASRGGAGDMKLLLLAESDGAHVLPSTLQTVTFAQAWTEAT